MVQSAMRVLKLEGVLNARELGGLPLNGNRQVRRGCLVRAGRLSEMTGADAEVLKKEWNVTRIVDLRNHQEVMEHPDVKLDGAEFHHLSIFPGGEAGISREDHRADQVTRIIRMAENLPEGGARGLLTKMYPDMVLNPFCIQRIREFFELLSEHKEGTFIWHCTSGKDRTGVTGAFLLKALGASWDTILEDYLLTNHQVREHRESLCEEMRRRGAGKELVQQVSVLESVEECYLKSCMSAAAAKYGSVEHFMKTQLGLTETAQEKLREKFTN